MNSFYKLNLFFCILSFFNFRDNYFWCTLFTKILYLCTELAWHKVIKIWKETTGIYYYVSVFLLAYSANLQVNLPLKRRFLLLLSLWCVLETKKLGNNDDVLLSKLIFFWNLIWNLKLKSLANASPNLK